MKKPVISFLLVTIQLATLLYLLLSGPILPKDIVSWLCMGTGLLLGVWAVVTMKIQNLRVVPDPSVNAKMIRSGPYNRIRHPMYTAVILVVAGLLNNYFSVGRMIVAVILMVDLFAKMAYEEHLLTVQFSNYSDYKKSTRRLIPFIY